MRFDADDSKTWPHRSGPWLVRCMGDDAGDTIKARTWVPDIGDGAIDSVWLVLEVVEYAPTPAEDAGGNWAWEKPETIGGES